MFHVSILETNAIDETSSATTIQETSKKGLSIVSGNNFILIKTGHSNLICTTVIQFFNFFILVTRAPDFSTHQDIDVPRINIDKSFDEYNQEENSSNTTTISGGIGGAVCLVALIAAMAVKRKRDKDGKIAEEIGNSAVFKTRMYPLSINQKNVYATMLLKSFYLQN